MSLETDVVDGQVAAYRARDVEAFLTYYSDDAAVVIFDGTVVASKQAMRERYGELFADNPELRLTIAGRLAAGEFVVDEEHLSGFVAGDMPTEITALAVYRVVDGKIAKLMLLR